MSSTAAHEHPPSLYELRRGTTVCFECYRSELNRQRAERLAAENIAFLRPTLELRSPFDVARLSERQVAHRQRMLNHLRDVAAV